MAQEPCSCSCGGSTNLISACSGAANTGYLSDALARNASTCSLDVMKAMLE